MLFVKLWCPRYPDECLQQKMRFVMRRAFTRPAPTGFAGRALQLKPALSRQNQGRVRMDRRYDSRRDFGCGYGDA